jgi:hypothetical protein
VDGQLQCRNFGQTLMIGQVRSRHNLQKRKKTNQN